MEVTNFSTKKQSDIHLAISFSIEKTIHSPGFECLACAEYFETRESFRDAWLLANENLKQYKFYCIEKILENVTELFDTLKLKKVSAFYLTINEKTLMILFNQRNGLSPHLGSNHKVLILRMEILLEIIINLMLLSKQKISKVRSKDGVPLVIRNKKVTFDFSNELNPTETELEFERFEK